MKPFLFLLTFIATANGLVAQTNEPILRMNTEMHTAKIGRISTDAAGKYVLTGSKDKTAKLWEAQTGKLIRTFRPPIGLGNEGMIYACALSPDGTIAAMGGWSTSYPKYKSMDIYLFNTQTSEIIHRITGLSNVIRDLEFSPNGRYLAAALGGSNGIRIYRTSTFALIKKDDDYRSRSENIAFAKDGRLASVCFDGYLRLYDAGFNLLKKQKLSNGEKPFSLAFSPDGKKLAVGYRDSPKLQVLNGYSLTLLYEPKIGNANTLNQKLNKVSFSKDGSKLIAGGFYYIKQNGKWWRQIRIWKDAGQGTYQDFKAAESTIIDIKTLPNGNILYSSAQPDWGILNINTGEQIIYKAADLNNFIIGDRTHLKINADGFEIGYTPNYSNPLTFDINLRKLTPQSAKFPSSKDKSSTLKVTNWKNTYAPKLNNQSLSFLKVNEICRSVDIANNEQTIVFGAEFSIYGISPKGKKLWRTPTQSTAWAVNIAANNKVVVAALSDGTLRWYRMTDGAHLLTLFLHPDRERWVLWTPSGYYDASPGAEELIGWHVNQGADAAGLFYPISRFRSKYYRPDVISWILDSQDEATALQRANERANRSTSASIRSVAEELPPTVKILSPTRGASVETNQVTIEYSVKSPNNEAVTGIQVKVDGRPVSTDRGLKPAGQRGTVQVTIPSANCTVSVIAENRFGSSEAATVDLTWQGQLEISIRPNLYILAIGVADYDNDDFDLQFPDDDAHAFKKAMEAQENLLYNRVVTKIYTDKEATKNNILDGLEWITNETTQHDVAMIFFAGHGVENNRGTFYYLPVEADPSSLKRTCLMRGDIQETVATISGKVLVFMDACHSGHLMLGSVRRGNPDITGIINELIDAENGAIVFSSSMGRQSSLEDAAWGHGAFTKALVEGLEGKAVNQGRITCKSLDLYVTNRVKELTNGEQSTTTNFPVNVEDFPIAIIK